ncbi:MAG TPA: sensor histidine kinase, partial [Nevskiales bacterium]|nr:sensor histidine kinase [Nevskiales bacterium]
EVDNPVPAEPQQSLGAGSALDNIRQRLALIYGGAAELRTEHGAQRFIARLRLPAVGPGVVA